MWAVNYSSGLGETFSDSEGDTALNCKLHVHVNPKEPSEAKS